MHRPLLLIFMGLLLLSGCGSATDNSDLNQPPTHDVWLPELDDNVGPLHAIRVVTSDDVWVAGETGRNNSLEILDEATKGLVAHWDGTEWTVEARIGDGTNDYTFHDIDVAAPDDVWAVGKWERDEKAIMVKKPLIAHWDGKDWEEVSLPEWSDEVGTLNTIEVVAPDDVWVGGNKLIHWDGSAWTVVEIPLDRSSYWRISDLAAVSSTDIWAVAGSAILHWNGNEWSVAYDSKKPGPYQTQWYPTFYRISASSADNVWAIAGLVVPTDCGGSYSYILRWNDDQWSEVDGLITTTGLGCARGSDFRVENIYASAPDKVWVWGWDRAGRTLAQWSGSDWKRFDCPMLGSTVANYPFEHNYDLEDFAETPDGELWIVGSYDVRKEPYSTGWTAEWLYRGWIAQAYMGQCPPLTTPTPKPATVTPSVAPSTPKVVTPLPATQPPYAPAEFPTVPLPAPSGVVPVPTGVTP